MTPFTRWLRHRAQTRRRRDRRPRGETVPDTTEIALPVLTMVTGYSRWLSAISVSISTRRAEDLFASWWGLIHGLGAVPRTLVWDGEGAIGRARSSSPVTARRSAVSGGQGGRAQPYRVGAQSHRRTCPRLSGAVVSARPDLHRPWGFRPPTAELAADRQRPDQPSAGLRTGRPDRCGPRAMRATRPAWRALVAGQTFAGAGDSTAYYAQRRRPAAG
jgi:hypothetical protein